MPWTATSRYGTDIAPGGLAFVHDFLNTSSAGRPRLEDLLSDAAIAEEWLHSALAAWQQQWGLSQAPEIQRCELKPRDLTQLRDLRANLMDSIRGRHDGATQDDQTQPGDELPVIQQSGAVLDVGALPDGTVYFLPAGRGWKRVLGPLVLEVRRAQDAGTWSRLKSCKNDRCRGVFYDRSRNNSGVWHDVRTCGNAANLRASRERRRAAAEQQHARGTART